MTIYYIELNQQVELYQKSANKVFTTSTSDVYVQFQFVVDRGSVGFRAGSKDWTRGGVSIVNENSVWRAKIDGVCKVELHEMHENKIANKTPVYIDGFGLEGGAAMVSSTTEDGQNNVDCLGETYPKAIMRIGSRQDEMTDY